MKIVVGLGNPGEKYQHSRHNAGFMCVDVLREQLSLPAWTVMKKNQALISKSAEWLLIQPQTFMNQSGLAVRSILEYYLKYGQLTESARLNLLKNVFVAHDDLDLRLGAHKIQFGRGPKVHNGLRSLNEHLGTEQFWHVRIGVDGRETTNRVPGREYVLDDFLVSEREVLAATVKEVAEKVSKMSVG